MGDRLSDLADWAWTWPFPLVILTLGVYYLVLTRAVVFTRLGTFIDQTLGRIAARPAGPGSVTPFRAFAVSLGTMVGLGNVAGVATALTMGGPGALFWMWFMGLAATTLNYAEVVLGLSFRVRSRVLGEYVSNRSYVFAAALRPRWLGRGLALAAAGTALLPPVAYLAQTQAVTGAFRVAAGWPEPLVALVMATTLLLVAAGELRSISAASEFLVSVMLGAYLGVGFLVLARHGAGVVPALVAICRHAFMPAAPLGGFAGASVRQAVRYGLARGAFSCNAATGQAMATHAAAAVDHPVRQGMWGAVEVLIDTLVVCSTTGLVVLVTGAWSSGATAGELVALAFDRGLPGFGGVFAACSALVFGWTTMLGLYYTTTRNFAYLLGAGSRLLLPAIYCYRVAVFCTMLAAPRLHVAVIWSLQDLLTAANVAVNVGAMVALGPLVARKTREFFG